MCVRGCVPVVSMPVHLCYCVPTSCSQLYTPQYWMYTYVWDISVECNDGVYMSFLCMGGMSIHVPLCVFLNVLEQVCTGMYMDLIFTMYMSLIVHVQVCIYCVYMMR